MVFPSGRVWRVAGLVLVLVAGGRAASAGDGREDCLVLAAEAEREYGIAPHLLQAIALTESGRRAGGGSLASAWPWTLNIEGEGRFFDTRAAAVAALLRLLAGGRTSVDVGCMQINWRAHPRAFASADQALDPRANVAYGARFLRQLYDEAGDWRVAAARYHSRNQSLGDIYLARVIFYHHQLSEGQIPRMSLPGRAAHVPDFPDRRFAQSDPIHAYVYYRRAGRMRPGDGEVWLGQAVAMDLLAAGGGAFAPELVIDAYAQAVARGGGSGAARRLIEVAAALPLPQRLAALQQAFRLSGAAIVANGLADAHAQAGQQEAAAVYREQARRIARNQLAR